VAKRLTPEQQHAFNVPRNWARQRLPFAVQDMFARWQAVVGRVRFEPTDRVWLAACRVCCPGLLGRGCFR